MTGPEGLRWSDKHGGKHDDEEEEYLDEADEQGGKIPRVISELGTMDAIFEVAELPWANGNAMFDQSPVLCREPGVQFGKRCNDAGDVANLEGAAKSTAILAEAVDIVWGHAGEVDDIRAGNSANGLNG